MQANQLILISPLEGLIRKEIKDNSPEKVVCRMTPLALLMSAKYLKSIQKLPCQYLMYDHNKEEGLTN